MWTHNVVGLPRLSEEAPPWWGATLDGMKRRQETRVPRAWPAPDGRTSGGAQPTKIRWSNQSCVTGSVASDDQLNGEEDEDVKISLRT